MTHAEFDKLSKDLVKDFSTWINYADPDHLSEMATQMLQDHRTLIQKKMQVFMLFVEQLDALYQQNYFDLRNEAACKLAHNIVTTFDRYDRILPHI